jgi:hypothetical protein
MGVKTIAYTFVAELTLISEFDLMSSVARAESRQL